MEARIDRQEEFIQETITCFWETFPAIWNQVRSNIREIVTENFDISVEQFHVLRLVRRGVDLVSDLAEVKQISRPAASQAVDGLFEKGLISRQQDSNDRRCVRLQLTPAGDELLNSIFQKNRTWMAERMQSLSAEELAMITDSLGVLKHLFVGSNQ